MCGIYGLCKREGGVDRGMLTRQRDRLAHRGPDDEGLWLSPDGLTGLAKLYPESEL